MTLSPTRGARRLLTALLIGAGTIFGAKAPHEHGATPPTMLVDRQDIETESGDRLPECA
jgi:hypothetical protein